MKPKPPKLTPKIGMPRGRLRAGTQVEEELDVAGGAGERGSRDAGGAEAALARERHEAFEHLVPERGIANDPALPDPAPADFELRLHQRHDVGPRSEAGARRIQPLPQGNEGYIDR